jgi:hypothetical protein
MNTNALLTTSGLLYLIPPQLQQAYVTATRLDGTCEPFLHLIGEG